MPRGKVKWFDNKKGYGFIQPEDGSADLFVHYSSIKSEADFKTLKQGSGIEYEVAEGKKGMQAVNVTLLAG